MARSTVCKRVYIDTDGEEYGNMPADPSGIVKQEFRFGNDDTDGVTVRVVKVSDFSTDIRDGAMLHGLNQALGDAFAGASGIVADAIADFDARLATLMSGVWTSRTGGAGARSDSILAEAMLAYFEDEDKTETKDGVTINAAWVRGYLLAEDVDDAKAKDVRSARAKSWKANDDVKTHYDRIRAEREAKKVSTVTAGSTEDI